MPSESPWKRLSEFITKINESVKDQDDPASPFTGLRQAFETGGQLFSRPGLGWLMMPSEDTTDFRNILNSIHESAAGKNASQMSVDAVEDATQVAVLKVLDVYKTDSETDFFKRLEREIEDLQRSLKKKLDIYSVHLEVQGLDPTSLPVQFGGIKFYVADQNSMPELSADTRTITNSDDQEKKKRIESHRTFRNDILASVKGRTYAEIEVEAFDSKAAGYLAESQLRLTVDVLNYFSDFFSREGAKVFLPGDAITSKHVAFVGKKGDTESQRIELSHKGPLFRFSFPSSNSPAKNIVR